jgi:dipeptidase E
MTNLLLYSDFRPGVSNIVDDSMLKTLEGKSCRIGYIPSDSDVKRRYFSKVEDQYAKLGLTDVFYFDLGEEFSATNIPDLLACDLIHLSGGDPVRFLELVRKRAFGEQLARYLKAGGTIMGVSAGAMILSKSLGLIAYDEAARSKQPGKPAKIKGALKFFDFEFYPHFKGDESTSKRLATYARSQKTTVYACDDDAGILIKNGVAELLGDVTTFLAH